MKIIYSILFIFLSFFAFNQSEVKTGSFDEMVKSYYKNTVPLIYPHEVQGKKNKNEKIVFLDTREQKEYRVSFIENALHVGYENFSMSSVKKIDKSTTIIMYCTIGARSEDIGEKLITAGYKNVYNLYGGLIYWKNKENPVYNKSGNKTEEIHVYGKEWGKWLTKGKAIY